MSYEAKYTIHNATTSNKYLKSEVSFLILKTKYRLLKAKSVNNVTDITPKNPLSPLYKFQPRYKGITAIK